MLGKGPVIFRGPNMNPVVVEKLMETAAAGEVPYQVAASGRATPTDANTIQTSRGGVATGLVSIPNRYMHSPVEMISLDDIDRAADLLAGFAPAAGWGRKIHAMNGPGGGPADATVGPLLKVIHTQRLILRPFGESDLDALTRINSDSDVIRFIGSGKPLDRAETWRQIAMFLGHQAAARLFDPGHRRSRERCGPGRCGPWFPDGWPMLEVGWVVDPAWRCQGIATEAARGARVEFL